MKANLSKISLILILIISSISTFAQDSRAQLPLALRNAYTEVNIGYINYPFSLTQFAPNLGYNFQSVEVPHVAVRLILYGYEFNKYLSAQLSYMRPVIWVHYFYDKNSFNYNSSVWMNIGGLTLKPQLPIGKRFSIYGEAGWGIITRHGFNAPQSPHEPLVTNANYSTILLGAGLKYQANDHWAWQLSTTYSPENKSVDQPATTFLSAGFQYKLLKVSKEKLEKAANTGYIHPANLIQIGYSSNLLGYGVNNALEKACLFWGGDAEVRQGISINYQRNIFHSAKYFSLNLGVSAGLWQTNISKQNFYALSVYPLFRYDFLHTKPVDAYFYYSVAGPSYISDIILDGKDTGKHFTFQDTMGAGVFFGEKRTYNAELKIGHYSNGNIFPRNGAVKIPLSLNVGYTF
ncbi:MAG TPA: acyloxyacyl hydrolase [Paludibacter sp.]